MKPNNPIFVLHKHFASRLHYDLRLEMDGVLKSWAVPKEPPTDSKTKRLAIAVEDHELSYADFEGEIPKGQYGAGKVEIWDKGTYELVGDDPNDGKKIEFRLDGKKMNGTYVLLNTNGKQWLFFRKKEKV
jgi:DNA ligase D-like protein (predicted 3'-phosphoesterase)